MERLHRGERQVTVERAIASKLNTLSKLTWPPSFGQDVLIVDPYTVRIITKIPDPMVPSRLAAESMCMAPPKGLAEYKDKFVPDRYIGTGPFRLAEYVVGDRVVVEANPSYWGPKPPSQRVVWQVIPDAATRLAALQRGDVDVMLNLPFPLAPNVESDQSLRLYSELSSLTHGILLNARESAPLKDRRVRQALNMAVDRQAIIKNLYSGRGHLLNTVTGKDVANTMDPGPYPYDPARAKALLAEAGFPNGFEFTLWQAVGRWVLSDETAQVIAGYWDKSGVKTKVQVLEWAEYNKRSAAGAFKDGLYYAFINGPWDASYTVQRFKPASRPSDTSTLGDLLKPSRSTSAPSIQAAQVAGRPGPEGAARRSGVSLPSGTLGAVRCHRKVKGFKMRRTTSCGCATPTWRPEALPFLLRRLGHAAIVALGVSLVVFALVHLSGDPVLLMVSSDAPADVVAATRHALGFDRPFYEQYARYVTRAAQGDLGTSLRSSRPVAELIMQRLPATVELTFAALLIAVAIAVPAGIISAVKRGSAIDRLAMVGAVAGQAVPISCLSSFSSPSSLSPCGSRLRHRTLAPRLPRELRPSPLPLARLCLDHARLLAVLCAHGAGQGLAGRGSSARRGAQNPPFPS